MVPATPSRMVSKVSVCPSKRGNTVGSRSLRKLINYLAKKRKFLLIHGGLSEWIWSEKLIIYSDFEGDIKISASVNPLAGFLKPLSPASATATASASSTDSSSSAQAESQGALELKNEFPTEPSRSALELKNYSPDPLTNWNRKIN